MLKQLAVIALSATMLAACANGGPNKQQIGTGAGAVIGGIMGSNIGAGQGRTAAIIGGTLLGAWAGGSIGASLDKADMAYYNSAQNQAYQAPVGQTISWNNPQSGNGGTITPRRDGYASNGAYCREFQQTITVDGRTEQAFGQACQMPDGTWRLVN